MVTTGWIYGTIHSPIILYHNMHSSYTVTVGSSVQLSADMDKNAYVPTPGISPTFYRDSVKPSNIETCNVARTNHYLFIESKFVQKFALEPDKSTSYSPQREHVLLYGISLGDR